ncbi:hypothetical protein Bca52824_069311 [Brassica carinata]|uniref:Inhibitor I9 domain-containing protein n=1 Tax=Brassica carinata TaxID=52824 RepID=A0A8X7U1A5_BRACI|nr:hypothetical protein Bca52824_069311 [Brassica carinata]
MGSRVLLVFFTFYICVVSSSRTLAPSPDQNRFSSFISEPMQQIRLYLVSVDYALYHNDCKKYEQLLEKVIQGRSPKHALVYCYKHVSSGFAATLTEKEAQKMKGEEGVLSVTKDMIHRNDGRIL